MPCCTRPCDKNLDNNDKEHFEKQTFGNLYEKMGLYAIGNSVKNGRRTVYQISNTKILLYDSDEYSDLTDLTTSNKYTLSLMPQNLQFPYGLLQ